MGPRGRLSGSRGVKGWAYRVSGGQGEGLLGPRESRGRPTRSQGVKGVGLQGPTEPRGRPSGSKGLRAKNRGEPRNMTHSSETEFFWGGPNGKVVAPCILVIYPVDKYCDSKAKNLLLAPNIKMFGSNLHIFVPSGKFELHRSMFSTRKSCFIGSLI